jgi:site-specific DNA-methyltransferase (adenine-specific)
MKSIHVLRKPCSESTVAANVLKHGTGGINVDGSRIGTTVETWPTSRSYPYGGGVTYGSKAAPTEVTQAAPPGRWPANLVLGACLDSELDSVFPHTKAVAVYNTKVQPERGSRAFRVVQREAMVVPGPGDSGSAARYFKRVN